MAGRLTPLFRMLAESWPATVPMPRLAADLGPEVVAEAKRLGLMRRRPLTAGMAYPCRSFCTMRVIEEEDGLVAICEHSRPRCPAKPIDEDEAFLLEFDVGSIAPVLQRLLGLDAVLYDDNGSRTVLGTRRVRGRWVRFVLAARPIALIGGWLDQAVREEPDRMLVILTFASSRIPASAPRRVGGVRVEWVGLDEHLGEDGIDLTDAWRGLLGARDDDAVPSLLVDEGRGAYTYGGHRLKLDRNPLAGRLLTVLARDAGNWVSRNALLVALYPEDFEGRSPDYVKLDRRLRQLKSVLSGAFVALPEVADLPANPLESLRTRSDVDGGYRIALDPERVMILS